MNTVASINPERVEEIFIDCLFKEGEETAQAVKVEGISMNVGFHPERLASYKIEIEAMLEELSDDFKASKGGGMSFLNACNDRNGNQWTGFQQRMDQLFMLGMGVGKAKYLLPREMWKGLPGGVPYYVIN